jgi:hypothetical protein
MVYRDHVAEPLTFLGQRGVGICNVALLHSGKFSMIGRSIGQEGRSKIGCWLVSVIVLNIRLIEARVIAGGRGRLEQERIGPIP